MRDFSFFTNWWIHAEYYRWSPVPHLPMVVVFSLVLFGGGSRPVLDKGVWSWETGCYLV